MIVRLIVACILIFVGLMAVFNKDMQTFWWCFLIGAILDSTNAIIEEIRKLR
jgi:hypothetical protein